MSGIPLMQDSADACERAVMDARNNLADQEVFKMARAADPEGIRTVGIITKCDALQAGDEQGVCNPTTLSGLD